MDLDTSVNASLSLPLIRKHDCGACWESHAGVNKANVFNSLYLIICSGLCLTIAQHYSACTRLIKIIVCLGWQQWLVISFFKLGTGSMEPKPFLRNQGFASDTWPCDASPAARRCVNVHQGGMESARVSSLPTCLEEIAPSWSIDCLLFHSLKTCSSPGIDSSFGTPPKKRIEEIFFAV